MAEVSTGLTVTFASGFFAEILSGKHSGIERESIETSHMGTTNAREYVPGSLYDPGALEVELQFDPATLPPIGSAAETVTINYSSGSSWAAEGFMTAFEAESPLEDKQTATATIKFSGQITVT